MRVPLLAVVTTLTLALTGTGARAATCPLVTDPAHDEVLFPNVPVSPDMPGLDVVAGDIDFHATEVVAMVRLRDLGLRGTWPYPRGFWSAEFHSSGTYVLLMAYNTNDGGVGYFGYTRAPDRVTIESIPVSGSVDTTTEEVRIVAPRSFFGPLVDDGQVLDGVNFNAGGTIGTVPPLPVLDVVRIGTDVAGVPTLVVSDRGCL